MKKKPGEMHRDLLRMNKNRTAAILALLPIAGYTISALGFFIVLLSGFNLRNAVIHRISDLALIIPTCLTIPFLIMDITALLVLKNNNQAVKGSRAIKIAAAAGLVLSTGILIAIGCQLLTGPSIHNLPNQ